MSQNEAYYNVPDTTQAFHIPSEQLDLEIMVTKVIQALCVPPHVKGYHYLREAIIMTVDNRETISSYAKILFPKIAEIFNTTPTRIDSGIRYALKLAWDRCDLNAIGRKYEFMSSFVYERPTNAEFIARVADHFKVLQRASRK